MSVSRGSLALVTILACTPGAAGTSSATTSGSTSADATGTSSASSSGGEQTTGTPPTTDNPGTSASTADPTTTSAATTNPDPTSDTSGGGGLGPAEFDIDDLDAPSHGGTITFQQIGAPGWYPSRRDPAVGPCDAHDVDTCCLAQHDIAGDQLTPWDEDLILTLRGPLQLKQFAVYQPQGADQWQLMSGWDDRAPGTLEGLAFKGNDVENSGFDGVVGTECLVDVSTSQPFACGPGSVPYCDSNDPQYNGWAGSKLFVLLATMPHADSGEIGAPCSDDMNGNWWNAPWIGLSHGELVRAGKFSDCHCYAKDPDNWAVADGCGQFNVFEVVNDNNQYQNFGVFSTNFFGYAGYVGEGPCGDGCDVSQLPPEVDLVDKGENVEAGMGAVATPDGGPGAAFRRPDAGYRYFIILMDTSARTVQLAVVHPEQIPGALAPLLPDLPAAIPQASVAAALALRLPQ